MNKSNFYEESKLIDDILKSENIKPNKNSLLEIIKKGEPYENYLFDNISDVKLLPILKEMGYFSAEKVPCPKSVEQGKYYSIPQWNVLPYLERISQQLDKTENEKYADELLTIIKEVTEKKIDNPRVWWYFVKILSNMPNKKIPLEIIDLIPIWLDTKFDATLYGSEIARKLLPKFLSDISTREDIDKAEKIINNITKLKSFPLEEKRTKSLGKKKEIKFAVDPYWLKETFTKYSEKIGEKCAGKVVEDLSRKIKILLKNKKSRISLEADKDNRSYMFILTEEESNYVVKIEKYQGKTEKDLFIIILREEKSSGMPVKEFVIKKSDKNKFANEVYENSKELFLNIETDILKRKISNLYRNLYDKGTFDSFYKESEYPMTEPLELFTFALKRILDAKAKSNIDVKTDETKTILKRFIEDNYLYFLKMAIYIIGNNIEKYKGLFWEWFDRENIFADDMSYREELKYLLQNLKKLSQEQKEKIRDKIEEGPKYYISEEIAEKYVAEWKQERYQPLIFDPFFKVLYEEKKEKTGGDFELEPIIGNAKTIIVAGHSPLLKEELLKKPNSEIAEFFSTFKPKNFFDFDEPTVEGLSEELKKASREQPWKFTDNLKPFLNANYFYVYKIIWGISEAWRDKKPIEWDKLFKFIKEYINRNNFWENKFEVIPEHHPKVDYKWILGIIGDLIQDGTENDNWAFPENCLDIAQEILFLIIDRFKDAPNKEIKNLGSHVLNSSEGKIITALIYLSLREARLKEENGKQCEVKWSENIRNRYEKLLDNGIIDAYFLFGRYMSNLYYLDKVWIEEKIKTLEKLDNLRLWHAFIEGQLYVNKIHDDLYKLMEKNYSRFFDKPTEDQDVNERFIQCISVGYLRCIENLSGDGLFVKILNKWDPLQIKTIIGFLWAQSNNESTENIVQKIIDFWRLIYKKYENKEEKYLTDDDKKILSEISKLAIFLPKIDEENFKWLELSASYVYIDFDYSFFIKYLDVLKNTDSKAEYIGKIFLKMLKEKFAPNYPEEQIRSIVEYLYKNKETFEIAKEICNKYGENGIKGTDGKYFLRDIYDKNDKKLNGCY